MRSRQVGQRGRSVGDSCGNPLRMDALRVSYVYTSISKMTFERKGAFQGTEGGVDMP
jgi:hypothetical protein